MERKYSCSCYIQSFFDSTFVFVIIIIAVVVIVIVLVVVMVIVIKKNQWKLDLSEKVLTLAMAIDNGQ